MPVVQFTCPSCRMLLQVAHALPAQVGCPGCGVASLVNPPPQAAAAAPLIPISIVGAPRIPMPTSLPAAHPAAPAGAPPRRRKRLVVALSLLAAVSLLVWIIGRHGVSGEDNDPSLTPEQRSLGGATQRGVAYLKRRLLDGSSVYSLGDAPQGDGHVGAVALAGLTLLECGVPPDDAALQRALSTVRGRAPRLTFTYAIATAILFLDRLNNPAERPVNADDRELIKGLALRLIAAQNGQAGWAYQCQLVPEEHERSLLKQLQTDRFVLGSFVVPGQFSGRDDNSLGQFATLALWAARRHGVPVRAPLKAVEARYRERQRYNGCWRYVESYGPYMRDASTCAGLIALAVGRGVDEEAAEQKGRKAGAGADLRKDPAVVKALGYLGQVVGKEPGLTPFQADKRHEDTAQMERLRRELEVASQQEKPLIVLRLIQLDQVGRLRGIYFDGDNWGDLYFLWSLERMAVIYGLREVDGKDWYAWGSQIILANQQRDGSWSERFPGVPDTCFALLFLRRANLVKDLTDKLRQAALGAPAAGAPPARPGLPPAAPPGGGRP